MSLALSKVSVDMYNKRQPKKLKYARPVLTSPLYIIFDTPQNWVAAGNTITAVAGDKIYIPYGNAYTHASATVTALPENNTLLNGSSATGDVDNSLTKYIFCPTTVNNIDSLPATRDVHIELSNSSSRPLTTGTAQSGTSNTMVLAAGESAVNSTFLGMVVSIVSGTGAGQHRNISAYVGSTKTITVSNVWSVTPDATSVYEINNGGLLIKGGNTVNVIGGETLSAAPATASSSAQRGLIRVLNQKTMTYFENVFLDLNSSYGRDGIEFGSNSEVEYTPDLMIQNCYIKEVFSYANGNDGDHPGYEEFGTVHADLVQQYGKHRFVFIDRFTGSTGYQGLFDDPQAMGLDRVYSNVNLKYLDHTAPVSEESGFLIYVKSDSASAITQRPYYNFHFENVFAQAREFYAYDFAGGSVYPQEGSANLDTTDYISDDAYTGVTNGVVAFPPVLGIYGAVRQGSVYGGGLFGDYVVEDRDAGIGVRTLTKLNSLPFYYDTTDCQLWMNVQQFYVINSSICEGTFGNVDVTSIQDMSLKYNHMTADNVEYLKRIHYARRVIDFHGDGYVSAGVAQLGDTRLFANATDAFFAYVVAEADDEGYIFAKAGSLSQIGFYVENDNLYGICRGAVTTIKQNWNGSMAFIAVNWDGSNLTYYFNEEVIVGNVGSGAEETGQNIVWGSKAGGTSSFFDGAIWGSRIYDRALTTTEIANLYYYENLYANLDGLAEARPDVPSVVLNCVETPTATQVVLDFDAPADDGGSAVLDYVYRYSLDEGATWSFWQLSTISTTTSTTITGLTAPYELSYEIYAVNAAGWSEALTGSTEYSELNLTADNNTFTADFNGITADMEHTVLSGSVFLTDKNGAYLVDKDNNYLTAEE